MPLQQRIDYLPPRNKSGKREIESGEDIVTLLRDVRASLACVELGFSRKTLKEVLAVVESGKYKLNGTNHTIPIKVDLKDAEECVRNYRTYSKRGCWTCKQHAGDTAFYYCFVHEGNDYSLKNKCSTRDSPMIIKHYTNPCEKYESNHFEGPLKSVEEIIEEAE